MSIFLTVISIIFAGYVCILFIKTKLFPFDWVVRVSGSPLILFVFFQTVVLCEVRYPAYPSFVTTEKEQSYTLYTIPMCVAALFQAAAVVEVWSPANTPVFSTGEKHGV